MDVSLHRGHIGYFDLGTLAVSYYKFKVTLEKMMTARWPNAEMVEECHVDGERELISIIVGQEYRLQLIIGDNISGGITRAFKAAGF